MNATDPIQIRTARETELEAVVTLLASDNDASLRPEVVGPPLPPEYLQAFRTISADPNTDVFVAVQGERVVGVFHFAVIQHLAFIGGRVAQIENVVVDPTMRSHRIGEKLMRFAIEEAERRKCFRVQLTSNRSRTRAHEFFIRLGFARSHDGFKMLLPQQA